MTRAFGQTPEFSKPLSGEDCPEGRCLQYNEYGEADSCVPCGGDENDDGRDDTDEMLKDASDALKALTALLNLAKTITDAKARSDFEKAVKDAQKKIIDGQNKMIDASNKINEATNGLNGANQQLNSLASSLSSIQNSMALELANITTIASALSGVNSQLSTATNSLAQAQARFDQALNRANYPAGITGLQQQRADLRSANLDIFNINSTINSLNSTASDLQSQMNASGTNYNNLIPQANAVRDGVQNAYDIAKGYESARNAGAQQFNDGANGVRGGFNDLKGASESYQNVQQNIIMPMVEGATATRGLSNALNNISQGNNYSAVADFMNAGLESGLRNAGNATASQLGGLMGTMISSAGQALDQTVRSGGTTGDFFRNLAVNGGNALVGANQFIQVGRGVEQAYQFANAGDWSGAGQALTNTMSPLVTGTSQVAQTGLLLSGMAPVAGAVKLATPGLATGATGITGTLSEMAQVSISQPTTPSSPRTGPGERGLIERQTSGAPGSLTIGGAGALITGYEIARETFGQFINNNPNYGSQASVTIMDMARSGRPPGGGAPTVDWGGRLSAGSVELRPPSAIPATLGPVVSGP